MKPWYQQYEIVGYIIEAYEGIEESPHNVGVMRRVFLWEEEDGDIKMGNAEAFVLHLGRKFGFEVKIKDAEKIHRLLRELGERVRPHKRTGDHTGKKYKQTKPDEWLIQKKKKK